MKERTSNILFMIGVIVFFAGLISIPIFLVGNITVGYETRYIVVEGEITDVEYVMKDNGKIDYLVVTFDNGETYKVRTVERYTDFTVNSKLIIELSNGYKRTWFWEEFEPIDDIYSISDMVKVPD